MKKYTWLLYTLAIVKLILPFFLQNSYYQPHRDEFLYLEEGRHMAWGFMEVPPLLSVFAWLTNLFGSSMFWIKFWPALFGSLTYLITGRIILSLGGRAFALVLAFLGFITAAYLRSQFLFQPNFLEIFFWTMIAWATIRFIQTNHNQWLYILGISIGLGIMSKYSVAFYTASIALGIALTKHRTVYRNKHLYYALMIGFLICIPNIIWQYNHRFPLVHHMQELQEQQLRYVSSTDFLINQLLFNFPCVFVWITGICFTAFIKEGKPYRFIAWAYLFVITLLIALHGKDYYALGAYPVLFAFGAYQLERFTQTRTIWWRVAFIIIPCWLGYRLLPLLLPTRMPQQLATYYQEKHVEKLGLLKWEDRKSHPLPQDFADMLGWKELTEKVAAVYFALPREEQSKTIIYCSQYAYAGAINFYGRNMGLPEAYSNNASFLLWMPDTYNFTNIIVVKRIWPDPSSEINIVASQCSNTVLKDSLNMPLARENGAKVILLQHANNNAGKILAAGILQEKSQFQRE